MSDGTGEMAAAVILVVDDDRATRLILRRGLEKGGHRVVEGENGAQTLSLCAEYHPDLVILDCMMPVMDGFTACARLKDSPYAATPVLMLTGLEDDRSVEIALQVGAADLVSKPVNWGVFNQRVSRMIQARRNEIMLDRSESGMRSLLAAAMDGIITINARGEIKSFNPAAENIFGYRYDEVEGKSVTTLLEGVIRQTDFFSAETGQDDSRVLAFNAMRRVTARRKDGSIFPAEVSISGFHSGDRLLTVRDVTERKEAERRIQLAARVFQSTAEGIMVTSGDGIIELVNPAFCAITGYSEKEALGASQRTLRSDRHDQRTYREIWDTCLTDGHWEGQLWNRRKNGEIFPLRLSSTVIRDEGGHVVQCVNVFADITEQVREAEEKARLQEQNVRAQRLASLGTMSAGIAHEINQPLNVIRVIVDGMLYWHKRGRGPEQNKILENLQKISTQVNRIDEIIKHMRSFISASGQTAALASCNLNEAVEGALGMLGAQMASHGITLVKRLAGDLPLVRANTNRLEEVAVNLLVNAMQAFNGSRQAKREVVLSTCKAGGGVVMEVADNATGIADEIMEKIFDPFFTTKTGEDGMGLGLSIVQSIASSYGGEIRAANNDRGGATFRLELPALPHAELDPRGSR